MTFRRDARPAPTLAEVLWVRPPAWRRSFIDQGLHVLNGWPRWRRGRATSSRERRPTPCRCWPATPTTTAPAWPSSRRSAGYATDDPNRRENNSSPCLTGPRRTSRAGAGAAGRRGERRRLPPRSAGCASAGRRPAASCCGRSSAGRCSATSPTPSTPARSRPMTSRPHRPGDGHRRERTRHPGAAPVGAGRGGDGAAAPSAPTRATTAKTPEAPGQRYVRTGTLGAGWRARRCST